MNLNNFELILYEENSDEISRRIVLSLQRWKKLNNIINQISKCFNDMRKNKETEMAVELGGGIFAKLGSPYMVLHIRKYYWSKDNLFFPSRSGVSMRYDEFRDLKAAMNEINPDLKLDLTE
jgi:hypothetical protein